MSSHRVIGILEHKNEEIEISPTVKRFWLQTILLAEHWASRRFDSHRGQAYFSSLPGVDIHSE